MKEKFIQFYMKTAVLVSELSYCKRRQVGAILVKNDRIISIGYNGTPSGWENVCEVDDVTKPEVLHAESNALMKLAQSGESSTDSVLFTTTIPCIECSKLIRQSGIKEVYYVEGYRCDKGKNFLIKSGIKITQVELT